MNRAKKLTGAQSMKRIVGAAALSVAVAGLGGCAATGETQNEGMRKGALGGAALGLTLGVLTGEPELAVAGAIAGGVAGGTAGMMADYEHDRKDQRAATIAGGLAGQGAAAPAAAAPARWDDIDKFPGQWRVDIWTYEPSGQRVNAQATATGSLNTTSSATMTLGSVTSNGEAVQIEGSSELSFDAARQSYNLINRYSTTNGPQTFVGEYHPDTRRYHFYYTGSDIYTRSGASRADYRLEMRFLGSDVIIFETQVDKDGKAVPIQSYRFTRVR